jgi:hypothetical protein
LATKAVIGETMKRTSRKPSILSEVLHRRLDAYALAASAAGVSALALVTPAEGKIVYTPTHVVIGHGGRQSYRLDFDGHPAFALSIRGSSYHTSTNGSHNWWDQWLSASPLAKRNGGYGADSFVVPLREGAQIGTSHQSFKGDLIVMMAGSDGGTYLEGFCNLGPRYFGARFTVSGATHYGWARFNVTCKKHSAHMGAYMSALLSGYAYEAIPNKPIIAGRTKGPDVITVQEPSLGHLAAGASAIPAWRTTGQAK